jgi:hypothetical protein
VIPRASVRATSRASSAAVESPGCQESAIAHVLSVWILCVDQIIVTEQAFQFYKNSLVIEIEYIFVVEQLGHEQHVPF